MEWMSASAVCDDGVCLWNAALRLCGFLVSTGVFIYASRGGDFRISMLLWKKILFVEKWQCPLLISINRIRHGNSKKLEQKRREMEKREYWLASAFWDTVNSVKPVIPPVYVDPPPPLVPWQQAYHMTYQPALLWCSKSTDAVKEEWLLSAVSP